MWHQTILLERAFEAFLGCCVHRTCPMCNGVVHRTILPECIFWCGLGFRVHQTNLVWTRVADMGLVVTIVSTLSIVESGAHVFLWRIFFFKNFLCRIFPIAIQNATRCILTSSYIYIYIYCSAAGYKITYSVATLSYDNYYANSRDYSNTLLCDLL